MTNDLLKVTYTGVTEVKLKRSSGMNDVILRKNNGTIDFWIDESLACLSTQEAKAIVEAIDLLLCTTPNTM